jgi:hypothetical protein
MAEGNWSPKDRENYMIRNFTIFILRHVRSEKNEIGGQISCIGRREIRVEFGWENLKERVHQEELLVDGSVILKLILRECDWGNTCRVWMGNLKERVHQEELLVDGSVILKLILRECDWDGVEWIRLTEDRVP